jgi:hypothetical protein
MRFVKDPDATLDYTFNWADWLNDGDAISSFTIDADDFTIVSESNNDTAVTVVLSGGTLNGSFPVRCRITTNDGYVDDRTIFLTIREK